MPGSLWAFEGVSPEVAEGAWIAPTAVVIGDVVVGAEANIWFGCVLRGDTGPIRVGARTNIQDGSILHIATGRYPCVLGEEVTVGHMAIVHACRLEDRAFVGMGATVLDGAVIETEGMLAAGGLLTPGKRIGAGELWAGRPARKMRDMDAAERAQWGETARHYVELAARFRAGLQPAR